MKALQGLAGTISSLTNIVISLLGLAIIFSATPPTNGTFPPSRETTMAKPSKEITILVKLVIVPANPCSAFIFAPFFKLTIESMSIVMKL